jgi:hypothetical protein
MTDATKQLRALRRRLVRELRAAVAPLLYASGYRTAIDPSKGLLAGSRAYRLHPFRPRNGDGVVSFRTLRGGIVIGGFCGFTEDGILTDVEGGGCVTASWSSIPVEDLVRLLTFVAEYRRTHPSPRQPSTTSGTP